MRRSASTDLLRRYWPLVLPIAYLLHLAEEWWGGEGLSAWTLRELGAQISPQRFVVINGILWPLFAVMTMLAIRYARMAWFLTSFGTLVATNATLHVLGSLVFMSYSPGVVTGVLLYLPLGGGAIVAGRSELPHRTFVIAVLLGFAAHAVVPLLAFV